MALNVGLQYVFHYGGMLNNETLALKDMPERLVNLGFQITKPQHPQGFSYPSFAGPMFSIGFSDGKHEGLIYNRVDNTLNGSRLFRNEDYILVFVK